MGPPAWWPVQWDGRCLQCRPHAHPEQGAAARARDTCALHQSAPRSRGPSPGTACLVWPFQQQPVFPLGLCRTWGTLGSPVTGQACAELSAGSHWRWRQRRTQAVRAPGHGGEAQGRLVHGGSASGLAHLSHLCEGLVASSGPGTSGRCTSWRPSEMVWGERPRQSCPSGSGLSSPSVRFTGCGPSETVPDPQGFQQ